jgi:hypothetical protein
MGGERMRRRERTTKSGEKKIFNKNGASSCLNNKLI